MRAPLSRLLAGPLTHGRVEGETIFSQLLDFLVSLSHAWVAAAAAAAMSDIHWFVDTGAM